MVSNYISLLFFVSEVGLLLVKRSKKGAVKSQKDSRSLLILWIVIAGSISAGFVVAMRYHTWPFAHAFIAGLIIAVVGFIIRWISIIQLGKMFTVDVSITSNHTLKTTGLYKVVRHPSYLGLILIIAGIGVSTGSLLSCIIIIIPTFLALNYRIFIEEKALTEEFGVQYESYKTRVSMLVPGLY